MANPNRRPAFSVVGGHPHRRRDLPQQARLARRLLPFPLGWPQAILPREKAGRGAAQRPQASAAPCPLDRLPQNRSSIAAPRNERKSRSKRPTCPPPPSPNSPLE